MALKKSFAGYCVGLGAICGYGRHLGALTRFATGASTGGMLKNSKEQWRWHKQVRDQLAPLEMRPGSCPYVGRSHVLWQAVCSALVKPSD